MNNNINNNQNYGVKLTIQQWSSDYAWGKKIFFFLKNVFNLIFLMNWNCGLKKIQAPQPNSEPSFKDT